MPRSAIRLCGGLRVEVDGEDITDHLPGGQARSALAYLIVNRLRSPTRGELIDVIWPQSPPKDPQAALRPVLSRLRRALPGASLQGRERLQITLPEPVSVDTEEAALAVERAAAAAARDDWGTAQGLASQARALLTGGFLPGEEGAWIEDRRRDVEELELVALELCARGGLAAGGAELRESERAARELIARSPFRESGYALLMEALAADGNSAEALRVYEALRRKLRDELGAAPAAEVQALHGELLAGGDRARARHAAERREGLGLRAVPLPAILSPSQRGAFVGREEELEQIRSAWRRARAGARSLVLLAGQPGIGKTRLASEFAVEAHTDGTVLYAGCPQEPMLPYQPIIEALRHYVRSQPPQRPLGSLGPGAADLARLIPEIPIEDDPESIPGDPETRRYMMLDAVDALIASASAAAPILLVLDDLHWADRPTLHLLKHLITSQRAASLLVVGTYRDAEAPVGEPLAELLAELTRTSSPERIGIAGLDADDVARLLRFYAGADAPAALLRSVREVTDGNPFFVEELVRDLIETGDLFEGDGRWSTSLRVDEISVPEGVEQVLSSRLVRLTEETQGLLNAAAVLGREFSFETLRSMAGNGGDDLLGAIEEAVDAQLIVEMAAPSGRPRYAFTHALVRTTLYRALSAPRRGRLHADAARAIEGAPTSGGDAEVAALARHYRLAGALADRAKAVEYSVQAGERARELLAFDDAAAHWEGAALVLEETDSDPELRVRLLIGVADLMVVVGDVGRQIDLLHRALALCERLGDDERAAQVHSRLGMAHSLMDTIHAEFLDVTRAFEHFGAARTVLERGEVRAARGHLEVGVATALTYGLRVPDGIAAGSRAMEIADAIDDELLWIGAAEAYAWHRIAAGDLEEGFATMERTFEAARAHERPFLAWLASNMSGQLSWGLGDPSGAQAFFERALAVPYIERTAYRQTMADGIGRCHLLRGELAQARAMLADAKPSWFSHSLKPLVDLWEGSWEEAGRLADEVLATGLRTGNRWDEQAALRIAALVSALRDRPDEAADLFERSLEIVVAGESPYFELWIRPDLARALAEAGRVEAARPHVDRCREILAGGEDWRGRAGLVAAAEAAVAARSGRLGEANALFTNAIETLERYRLHLDRADAMHQWGRALLDVGECGEAEEKFDAALATLDRLGVGEPLRERVERDRGRAGAGTGS